MTTPSSLLRHSTRVVQQPLSLADEQAASILSRLEQRDIAAALRSSLASSWESEEEGEDGIAEGGEEDAQEEKEEKKEQEESDGEQDGWTKMLHDIEVPLPRLRNLQNRPPP